MSALHQGLVRYLIVGGLAVVAHGYLRFTADLDLVLDLREDNLRRAVGALKGLGYQPRAPVPLEDFISAHNRSRWIREKGLTVFSLSSPEHPATEIDLFVEEPFDFDEASAASVQMEVEPGVPAVFVGLDHLLALKRRAGRPQDLQDIASLEALHKRGHHA